MNQLLASIRLMNDLRLIWIQSVSMCYYFCRSQSNKIYTKYAVKCKILQDGNIRNVHSDVFHMKNNYKTPKYKIYLPNLCWIVTFQDFHGK